MVDMAEEAIVESLARAAERRECREASAQIYTAPLVRSSSRPLFHPGRRDDMHAVAEGVCRHGVVGVNAAGCCCCRAPEARSSR